MRRHWRSSRRTTAALLIVWFVATFGVAWFARELDMAFFGWPFSFWVAAQGAPVLYLVLVAVYTWRIGRLDDTYGDVDAD